MLLADILFYIFSAILLTSAFIVVSTRNTVHSVMFLILAFFNAAGLFVLLGAEFLAMLLVIVYVGAIAVLFLFVVMMLDIDRKEKIKQGFNKYLPISILVALTLFAELVMLIHFSVGSFDPNVANSAVPTPTNVSNSVALGNILYTTLMLPFQLAGMILFVAMIGAIVLTLRDQDRFIRKQEISKQTGREKSDAVEIVKVEVGKGVNI